MMKGKCMHAYCCLKTRKSCLFKLKPKERIKEKEKNENDEKEKKETVQGWCTFGEKEKDKKKK